MSLEIGVNLRRQVMLDEVGEEGDDIGAATLCHGWSSMVLVEKKAEARRLQPSIHLEIVANPDGESRLAEPLAAGRPLLNSLI
jgi:hypothetical protein